MNLIDKLKNCPIGMELDCTMYDNVRFNGVTLLDQYPIEILIPGSVIDSTLKLTEEGKFNFHSNAKCVIFPKGKTSWEGFVPPCKFKDGDVIFTLIGCPKDDKIYPNILNWLSIFKEERNGGCATYVDYSEDGKYYNDRENKPLLCLNNNIIKQRLATEEEKERLFNAIKANGRRWNPYTKKFEILFKPIFKIGDVIQRKDGTYGRRVIDNVFDNHYTLKGYAPIFFDEQDEWELIPNKFDITKLIPFKTEVLVSDDCGRWVPAIFGYYDKNQSKPFMTVGGNSFNKCIPYKGNEHLRGTTNECDKYFNVWE